MSGATLRCKFVAAAKPAPGRTVTRAANSPKPKGASRTARMLALAHHVERLIEAGELTSYTEAARSLGLTRARLTQVMNLLVLAPEIQTQLIICASNASERSLREIVREPSWADQCRHVREFGQLPDSEAKS